MRDPHTKVGGLPEGVGGAGWRWAKIREKNQDNHNSIINKIIKKNLKDKKTLHNNDKC